MTSMSASAAVHPKFHSNWKRFNRVASDNSPLDPRLAAVQADPGAAVRRPISSPDASLVAPPRLDSPIMGSRVLRSAPSGSRSQPAVVDATDAMKRLDLSPVEDNLSSISSSEDSTLFRPHGAPELEATLKPPDSELLAADALSGPESAASAESAAPSATDASAQELNELRKMVTNLKKELDFVRRDRDQLKLVGPATSATVALLQRQNRELLTKIQEQQFQLEAAAREKRILIERIEAFVRGRGAHPATPTMTPSSSIDGSIPPAPPPPPDGFGSPAFARQKSGSFNNGQASFLGTSSFLSNGPKEKKDKRDHVDKQKDKEEKKKEKREQKEAAAGSEVKSRPKRWSIMRGRGIDPLTDKDTDTDECKEQDDSQPPPQLQIPEEEGILYHVHKGHIEMRGATKEKLISLLYTPNQHLSLLDYGTLFLLTYRSFMKPKELLDALAQEFTRNLPDPSLISEERDFLASRRVRICNFLKRWAETFYLDFERDPELVEDFMALLRIILEQGESKEKPIAASAEKYVRRRMAGEAMLRQHIFELPPPTPVIPSGAVSLDTIDAAEFARQLTLIEFELYKLIAPKELLTYCLAAFSKAKDDNSPSVLRMIRRFNEVSAFVTTTLVSEPNLKRRQGLLRKFIRIAEECYKLNNFNAVFEITAGLTNTAVHRLSKTWEAVRGKKSFYEWQEKITTNKGNFKFYKESLALANPPCIPYLGVYLSALTFIDQGNKDMLPEPAGYVNMSKRRLISDVMKEIQQFQQKPYNLTPVLSIVEWMQSAEVLDDNESYRQSKIIEPPAQPKN
eukprot:TRINITY_DN723_c0_g2_i5.p1 TRINITY_DN723_c0_g2~~TRINITY_DN723_c0_g2_i5.p1  ORF type:complete len:797 (+),score=345.38 TRINITY_DN723_c0_g2_i5:142-2532(+)